jgi:phage anti-repressor protein
MSNSIVTVSGDSNQSSPFSIQTAQKIFNSTKEFPVDLNDAWQWLGYDRKDSAKRFLIENLELGIDYHINVDSTQAQFGKPRQDISLSIEGFKAWGMMSRTRTGKLIRNYFLECEKLAKQKTSFESIANEKDWGKLRTDGKQYRRTYTDRIKEAGGKGSDYAKATNEIYIGATGLSANQIKEQRGLSKSKRARDALSMGELQIVAMTEWHLSEALPNGSNLGQINQASRSQAERLKSALLVF